MQNNKQKRLLVEDNIIERTYMNRAYTNKQGEKGICLVFDRPFHEKAFKEQRPKELLTIKQYEEKYKVRLTW